MANATPNQVLDQLATDLAAVLVSTYADVVYDHRTLPNKLARSVALTYRGGLPTPETTAGPGGYYDFVAALVYGHDTSEAELEAAERGLNDIEYHIWATLYPSKNTLWKTIQFIQDSIRPPAPPELPRTRYGEVYFRVHLR